MRKRTALFLAFLLGALPLAGCAAQAKELTAPPVTVTAAHSQTVDAAVADLGLELVKAARAEDGVLLSPLSAALALSMAANGAQGETLAQMEVFLSGSSLEELNAACAHWLETYSALGGSTKSAVANSLWVDPDGQVSDAFIGTCRGIFDAQVFQTARNGKAVVDQVNDWISRRTDRMIPSLFNQPLPQETAAILVNALYLDTTWASKFKGSQTKERDFIHSGGKTETMDFLHKHSHRASYISTESSQGVVLPYDDGKLGFFALLPDLYPDSPGLDGLLKDLDGETLTAILSAREDVFFETLSLPKFEQAWTGNLADLLAGLGLDLPFSPAADFSALGSHPDGYYLSQVVHAARIQVHEEGSRAAAATKADLAPGAPPPPENPFSLVFDHPFLYGIADLETGLPLFLGTFE